MKNATIFHCRGGSPQDFWYPWLKAQLELQGFTVNAPTFPDSEPSPLSTWLPYALEVGHYDTDTILVGHSSGATLILSLLENLDHPIKQAILVSGFSQPLNGDFDADPILQREYDWDKIKSNVDEVIFINSDNDPFGCDDRAGKEMQSHLGGILVVPHDQGHMGSFSYNQPYKEFPLLLRLIQK